MSTDLDAWMRILAVAGFVVGGYSVFVVLMRCHEQAEEEQEAEGEVRDGLQCAYCWRRVDGVKCDGCGAGC